MKIQFTTRIEADLMEKMKAIAEEERRSLNNMAEVFIAKAIETYEQENGVIDLPPDK
jgi:hypothetical protein